MSQNGHRDVIIRAPAAGATTPFSPPSPEEVVAFQAARIRELEVELGERTVAASTIANAAVNLLNRLVAWGHTTHEEGIIIDKETWEKTRGMQLTMETNGVSQLMTVRAREVEKPAPMAWEDRQDG